MPNEIGEQFERVNAALREGAEVGRLHSPSVCDDVGSQNHAEKNAASSSGSHDRNSQVAATLTILFTEHFAGSNRNGGDQTAGDGETGRSSTSDRLFAG